MFEKNQPSVKTKAVIQARMGSSRLRGKSLMKVGNLNLIDHVMIRALKALPDEDIVLATSTNPEDDVLCEYVGGNYNIAIFRGSPTNVRSRFISIAEKEQLSHIIRLTADDPFKDPDDILLCKGILETLQFDYVCNFKDSNLPLGMDVEGFSTQSLLIAASVDDSAESQEHVTNTYHNNQHFRKVYIVENRHNRNLRLTVDWPTDLKFCSDVANVLDQSNFSWQHTLIGAKEILRNVGNNEAN